MSSSTSEPRRPASAARAEASRRNGARSRGPVTAAGKARASRNALRHGLTASVHLVTRGEDPEALTALREGLREELGARGLLASCLADRLAVAIWKLARADRLEATLATIEPRCPTGRLFPEPGLPRLLSRLPELSLLLRYQAQFGRELQRLLRLLNDPAFAPLLDAAAEPDPTDPAEAEDAASAPSGSGEVAWPEAAAECTPFGASADPTPDATPATEAPDPASGSARGPAVVDASAPLAAPLPPDAQPPTERSAGPTATLPNGRADAPLGPRTVADRLLLRGDLAGFLRLQRDLDRSPAALRELFACGPGSASGSLPPVAAAGATGPVGAPAASRACPPQSAADSAFAERLRNEPEPTFAPPASSPASFTSFSTFDPSSVVVGPRPDHPASSSGEDPRTQETRMAGSAADHEDGRYGRADPPGPPVALPARRP